MINQEQIALLELTFHSDYGISCYMYSHSGFCKENGAKPKKNGMQSRQIMLHMWLYPFELLNKYFSSYYYFYYLCCGCLGLPKFDPFLFS